MSAKDVAVRAHLELLHQLPIGPLHRPVSRMSYKKKRAKNTPLLTWMTSTGCSTRVVGLCDVRSSSTASPAAFTFTNSCANLLAVRFSVLLATFSPSPPPHSATAQANKDPFAKTNRHKKRKREGEALRGAVWGRWRPGNEAKEEGKEKASFMRHLLLGVLVGFLGAGALAALLRRFAKSFLFRLTGLADELAAAQAKADRKNKAERKKNFAALAARLNRPVTSGIDKNFLSVQLSALAVLNQESGGFSKSFTFWQRRTSKIQSDLDRLRSLLDHPN